MIRQCRVQDVLQRGVANTITVSLQPQFTICNQAGVTIEVVEPGLEVTPTLEGKSPSTRRKEEEEEQVEQFAMELGPSVTQIVCQNEVCISLPSLEKGGHESLINCHLTMQMVMNFNFTFLKISNVPKSTIWRLFICQVL